jgi:hypothetical protein
MAEDQKVDLATVPFYRRPLGFILIAAACPLIFTPLLLIPALILWTGPVYYRSKQNETAEIGHRAKVLITGGITAIVFLGLFVGASWLLSRTMSSSISCSSSSTLTTLKDIFERDPILRAYGPLTVGVDAIRTMDELAGNAGYRCRAEISVTGDILRRQFDTIYRVQSTDDRQLYVNVERILSAKSIK